MSSHLVAWCAVWFLAGFGVGAVVLGVAAARRRREERGGYVSGGRS